MSLDKLKKLTENLTRKMFKVDLESDRADGITLEDLRGWLSSHFPPGPLAPEGTMLICSEPLKQAMVESGAPEEIFEAVAPGDIEWIEEDESLQ